MFTGIIQGIGRIESVVSRGGGKRLVVDSGPLAHELALGDSLAVDGVCLTVEQIDGTTVGCYSSPETLQRSTLKDVQAGRKVNLEPSLKVGQSIGGHFVQGHVDAMGRLLESRKDSEESWILRFEFPPRLRPRMVEKGSIAVDGVSLTIASIDETEFSVAVVPFTMEKTILGVKQAGDAVNVECDILAKQIHQFLARYTGQAGIEPESNISWDFLQEAGFMDK